MTSKPPSDIPLSNSECEQGTRVELAEKMENANETDSKCRASGSRRRAPIDVGEEAERVKTELRIIYRKHAPSMLMSLPKLLLRFRGREQELLDKVREKYKC